MPRADKYKTRLTDAEVLELFTSGAYRADLETGGVFGRRGELLKPHFSGREGDYLAVRLYGDGERQIAVHKIIWMVGTNCLIPEGWEVHHRNEDPNDNRYSNLFCLHPDDHRKLHGRDLVEAGRRFRFEARRSHSSQVGRQLRHDCGRGRGPVVAADGWQAEE